MMASNHSHDDQGRGMESLSALFDGELQGDAARFAMKRLAHDPQWQRSFGNWQLLGDALRGQAGSIAPADFAARVSAAVVGESVPRAPAPGTAQAVASVAVPARAVARRKWIGGAALAASMAVVAMFVARPFPHDGGTAMPAPAAPTGLATAAPPVAAPADRNEAISAAAALPVGVAAIAVAEVPRRVGDRRSRAQGQRVAPRTSNRQAATVNVARAETVGEPAPRMGSDPFGPPQVEVVSRPWPRAVPATGTDGAFTASFHGGAAGTPSFYPFEPRLPNAVDAVPMPANGNGRR